MDFGTRWRRGIPLGPRLRAWAPSYLTSSSSARTRGARHRQHPKLGVHPSESWDPDSRWAGHHRNLPPMRLRRDDAGGTSGQIKKGAAGPFRSRSDQITQLADLGSLKTKIELPEPVGSGISGKAEEIELAAFE